MTSQRIKPKRSLRLIASALAVVATFLAIGIAIAAYNLVSNHDFSNGTTHWSLVDNNATMAIGVDEPIPVRCPGGELEMGLLVSSGIVQQCILLSNVTCSGASSTWTLQSMLRSSGPTLAASEQAKWLVEDLSGVAQPSSKEPDCCGCPCAPAPPNVDNYITTYVHFYNDSTCGAGGGALVDSLASSWWASGFMNSPTGIPVTFTDSSIPCNVQSAAVRIQLQGPAGAIGCADNILLCNGAAPCELPPLAVTMGSFTAEPQLDAIRLAWTTLAEIDVMGFNLYRRETSDAPGAWLAYVPAQSPGSSQGNSYTYDDAGVQPGQVYYFWLESIALDGSASLHGPVSAAIQTPTAVGLNTVQAASAASALNVLWALAAMSLALAGSAAAGRRSYQACERIGEPPVDS